MHEANEMYVRTLLDVISLAIQCQFKYNEKSPGLRIVATSLSNCKCNDQKHALASYLERTPLARVPARWHVEVAGELQKQVKINIFCDDSSEHLHKHQL